MKQRLAQRGARAPANSASEPREAAWPRVSRIEGALVLVLVLVGGALRLGAPGRMAVEHFDEGVYASNLWFGAEAGYQYPNRPLYAPPLTPFLIEWAVILGGPNGIAPLIPGVAAGWATVALVWWTGRRWFGPPAGAAAAALAAFSDLHVLYSRTALTDALLCFWLLLSVGLAGIALRRGRYDFALAAGAAAGLAWWTKYNGWLAVGIAFGGGACWVLFERRGWSDAGRVLGLSCAIAAVAAIVWAPVWIGLQDFPGGYSAVAANHARYVVGLEGWFDSAKAQLSGLRALGGLSGAIGFVVALLAAALAADAFRVGDAPQASGEPRAQRRGWGIPAMAAAGGLALSGLIGTAPVLGVLAFGGLAAHLGGILARGKNGAAATIGGPEPWLLGVWLVGLTLATPLYHPYPRLTLPWLVAGWLGAGMTIGQGMRGVWCGVGRVRFSPPSSLAALATAILLLLAVVVWRSVAPSRVGAAWQSRKGLRSVAEKIVYDTAHIAREEATSAGPPQRVLFVYAEPALFYHLNAVQTGKPAPALVLPAGNLRFERLPPGTFAFLAAGLHARRTPEFAEHMSGDQAQFELVANYDYAASDLTLSDNFPPQEWSVQRVQTVALYRLR